MDKVLPLSLEQQKELSSWVETNRDLINEVYIPHFNSQTRYYKDYKFYMYGVWISEDLHILKENYLYNKMKSQQNGTD